MRSFTCVSVVVYVARKLRPCPSYSRRRDRINLVLWRSLDKGGGGTRFQNLVKTKVFFFTRLLGSHLAHKWATSNFAPRSEAEGTPEAAGVK